jgi:hypothetical protein
MMWHNKFMSDQVAEVKLDLEKKILKAIADQLRNHNLNAKQSSELSKQVLSGLHKSISLAEIHAALFQLTSNFTQLKSALDPIIDDYNSRIKEAVNQKVDEYIKKGDIKGVQEVVAAVYSK